MTQTNIDPKQYALKVTSEWGHMHGNVIPMTRTHLKELRGIMEAVFAEAITAARLDERRRISEKVSRAYDDPTGLNGEWFRTENQILEAINASSNQSEG